MSSSTKTNFGLKAALSLSVGFGALMAGGITASAQDEGETTKRLNTITTTAAKREQTLQDVPIAVSVVDNEVIEKANIVDILDLQSVVPSLRVSQLQQAGNSTFIIRGFGNGGNNIGVEPSVAVYIDGVYRTRASGGLSDYSDVSRIEVLRGPQSTLFGKNASAGVISVVTQKPQFDFGGNAQVTLGNYNQQIYKGNVTGPLSDNVAFALSGSFNTRDGYAENVTTGTAQNERNRYAIKGQLLIEPSEDVSIRLIADYDSLDEICCYTPNIINGPTGPIFASLGGQIITDPFSYTTAVDIDPRNEITNGGISGQVDWETSLGTLTSITSLRQQEHFSDGDVDFNSLRAVNSNVLDYTIDTFTHEMRLAGSVGDFDYLVGGFYFDETVDLNADILYGPQFYDYANIAASGAIAGLETALGLTPRTFFTPDSGSREDFDQDNQNISLFSQTDWHLSDRLTATLGLSYTVDEKTVTGTVVGDDEFNNLDLFSGPGQAAISGVVFAGAFADATGLAPTPANIGAFATANPAIFAAIQAGAAAATPGVAAGLRANFQSLPSGTPFPNQIEGNTSEDDKVTYNLRLAYDVNENVNIYGGYATGFKPSSWNLTRNSSFTPNDGVQLAALGLVPPNRGASSRLASPEDTSVWELGAKMSTDTFNLNVAFFDQTIRGFQSVLFQGTGFALVNAGKQSTRGIEWDATWGVTDNLTLTFAGLAHDPTYDSFQGAPVATGGPTDLQDGVADGTADLSGRAPGGISETSLFYGAQYDFDLSDDIAGFVRADYVYESEVQVIDNVDGLTREVGTLNASLGLEFANGFDVSVWGRNLNDDEYFQSAFPTVAQPGSVNGYANAPKTYGVTVRKAF